MSLTPETGRQFTYTNRGIDRQEHSRTQQGDTTKMRDRRKVEESGLKKKWEMRGWWEHEELAQPI